MRELLRLENTLGEGHEIEIKKMIKTLEVSSNLRMFFNSVNNYISFDSKAIRLQGVLYS